MAVDDIGLEEEAEAVAGGARDDVAELDVDAAGGLADLPEPAVRMPCMKE